MRVLYLADIRFPLERANGIQSMATCHALAARGHTVTLLVRPDSHQPARDPYTFYGVPQHPGLTIEVVPITGPAAARRTGYLTYALARSLGRARQDLLFTRDLGLAALLLRVPPRMRAPLVYEGHGLAADNAAARPALLTGGIPASAGKLRRLAARDARVWRAADGYVAITQGLARELERRFGPRRRIAVVPDGVSLPPEGGNHGTQSRPRLGPPTSDVFTIGYAGHLYPWKGVDLIVEAVAALGDTRALIVGGHEQEPDLERVRGLALQLDCASRVTITGLLPPPLVADRLCEADVLVLPNPASAISTGFTSPLKLFEYMAAGKPIVAADLPSIREVLTDGENAVLVEPGNPQALTAGIRRVRDDRELASRIAAKARDDVRQYTWDARAGRLEALFQQVAGATSGGEGGRA